jgi:hypothetical protein
MLLKDMEDQKVVTRKGFTYTRVLWRPAKTTI